MKTAARMGIDDLLKDKRGEILRIAARHGARNVRVFGSVRLLAGKRGLTATLISSWRWKRGGV